MMQGPFCERGGTRARAFLFWLWFLCLTSIAYAHKPSDSYLTVRVEGSRISGQWDLALRDLEYAIGLDENEDGAITWAELRAKFSPLDEYVLLRLKLKADGLECPLEITQHLVETHTDGTYAVVKFITDSPEPLNTLQVNYQALFDLDPQHRGLLRLEKSGSSQTAVFGPDRSTQYFTFQAPNLARQIFAFGCDGVRHIWMGFDHILFLLALLLPAVLQREREGWIAVSSFRRAFVNVFKIVTAFTVAHSITLSLATLQIVQLPSRLVESAIAASVIIAAINNLYPFFRDRAWLVAFAFGLIHGFGFASVLNDLGLGSGTLAFALVGFNLGVEAGQLTIVSLFLPVAFGIRRSWIYRGLTLGFGSTCIAVVAAVWMSERLFNFKVLPF